MLEYVEEWSKRASDQGLTRAIPIADIQLEVFLEEAITAVAAFKGRRVLVGSASGVLAWTTIPIETSQPARLARLASVPARNGSKKSYVMEISISPEAVAFCAGLSGGQLWAGYIRKQPAVRCVMQSTWMVKGLTSATSLSRGRVVAAGENTVFLFKMGTPAPVWTHEMGFSPLRVGRVGPDLIGVVGDGAKLRTLSVEESTVKVLESMCSPVPWGEPGAILHSGGGESSCWIAHDAVVAEVSASLG